MWSGKHCDDLIEVESGVYAKRKYVTEVKHYLRRVEKTKVLFLILVFSLTGIMVIFSIMNYRWGLKASLVGLGISLVVFPYATPLTTQALGIQKSKVLVRVVAFVLIIGALFL